MSILAMAANSAKVTGRSYTANTEDKWCKSEPRQVKINVDAYFHADSHTDSSMVLLLGIVREMLYLQNYLSSTCGIASNGGGDCNARRLIPRNKFEMRYHR
jgi:hypothetical protein